MKAERFGTWSKPCLQFVYNDDDADDKDALNTKLGQKRYYDFRCSVCDEGMEKNVFRKN